MAASRLTSRISRLIDYRKWAWWQLPVALRALLAGVASLAFGLSCYAASQATWRATDLLKYLLLIGCGAVTVAASTRVMYPGGMTRDFISAWVFPVAIVLPPVYAMVAPILLQLVTRLFVNKGIWHRRVYAAGSMSLSYGAASAVFRALPLSPRLVVGTHALTWILAVLLCEMIGGRGHHILLLAAIKISDPSIRLSRVVLEREAMQADLAESDLGVVITVVVGVNVVLAVIAIPMVLLIRRFMMHELLLAQARTDTKTGLLNSSTWETEAGREVERAVRTGSALSVLLIDIDHFKRVNDTYGHLAGDVALRAVADAVRQHPRGYDLAGRFGGEEFVVLLPNASQADAIGIAERLRTHIAALAIPARNDDGAGPRISLTVSVGVSSLTDPAQELADLMAAADGAMYRAKQGGRNQTRAVRASRPLPLGAPAPRASAAADARGHY